MTCYLQSQYKILCYRLSHILALSYFQSLQKDYHTLVTGQAETTEVDEVINKNLTIIALALMASVVVAAAAAILLRAVQPAVTEYVKGYPWSIMVLGLAAVLILAGLLYWIGTSRQKSPG